jgi:hypothetical protein
VCNLARVNHHFRFLPYCKAPSLRKGSDLVGKTRHLRPSIKGIHASLLRAIAWRNKFTSQIWNLSSFIVDALAQLDISYDWPKFGFVKGL